MINKHFLVKWKIRFQLAASVFSMFGVPYLVAVQAQEQLLKIGIVIPFLAIMISGIVGLLIVGYFYDELGFFTQENGYTLERNYEWQKKNTKN